MPDGPGLGTPTFGYRLDGGGVVADDDEQAALARILELRGRSLREIIAVLDAEGRRPKRSRRWHPQTIARILARAAKGGEPAGKPALPPAKPGVTARPCVRAGCDRPAGRGGRLCARHQWS